jgi:hypothetical protein
MSNLDLHLHLHFALFKHSAGCTAAALELTLLALCTLHRVTSPLTASDVLKPAEQRLGQNDDEMGHQDEDNYWPPLREQLLCTSLEVLSLHNLPKVMMAITLHSTRTHRLKFYSLCHCFDSPAKAGLVSPEVEHGVIRMCLSSLGQLRFLPTPSQAARRSR